MINQLAIGEMMDDVNEPVVEGTSVEEQVAPVEPTPQQKNFAALRAKAEAEERGRIAAEEKAKALEAMLAERNKPVEREISEDTGNIDFSGAVDAEPLQKLDKRSEAREKRLQKRIDQLEMLHKQQTLASKDPSYVDVINKYLPGVLKDNPSVRGIIEKAHEADQFALMYQFATSSKDYVLEKYAKTVKGDVPVVEEEKPRMNTAGALKGTSAIGKESVYAMPNDAFYGPDGYLAKVLANKIH